MRLITIFAWLLGAALLAGLVAINHPGEVLGAVGALRYWLAVIVAVHLVPLSFDVAGWRLLFTTPPRFGALFVVRWLAESVNGLLPVPHLGELLRADLARRISPAGEAGPSVVVDLTLGVAAEALFAAAGLALFSTLPGSGRVLLDLLLAIALLAAATVTLYVLQRAGLFALAAAIMRRWIASPRGIFQLKGARAIDRRVGAIYERRGKLARAGAWRLAGWFAGAGETWLILYALGHPVGIGDAIILESLSQAARTAAFVIPGGLGVQDGALLLLCGQLGLPPELGLAVSLVKRFRELVLGAPGLVISYTLQAHRLTPAVSASPREPPAA
jgi:putative membrane protein